MWHDSPVSKEIQKNLEEMHPGFLRPLNLRKERFNMHKTKGSLLFEIGTHGNTQLEALRSAEILAEGIIKTLKVKK
jgi:stage II sporulation protein P